MEEIKDRCSHGAKTLPRQKRKRLGKKEMEKKKEATSCPLTNVCVTSAMSTSNVCTPAPCINGAVSPSHFSHHRTWDETVLWVCAEQWIQRAPRTTTRNRSRQFWPSLAQTNNIDLDDPPRWCRWTSTNYQNFGWMEWRLILIDKQNCHISRQLSSSFLYL